MSSSDYVKRKTDEMNKVFQLAKERTRKFQDQQAYDHRATKLTVLSEGQKVFIFDPSRRKGVSPKLVGRWKGPGVVMKRINDWAYRVKFKGKEAVRHRNHLHPIEIPPCH